MGSVSQLCVSRAGCDNSQQRDADTPGPSLLSSNEDFPNVNLQKQLQRGGNVDEAHVSGMKNSITLEGEVGGASGLASSKSNQS